MPALASALPGVRVGYSDHTLGIEVAIAAVALGATVIEKHFTLDKNLPGPDHAASLEPAEQTVVLGGLIREQKVESRSGIPGLYNMPIIGPLFGTTVDEQLRTELVVLITPRAVKDSVDAAQVTDEFRSKMESLRPLTPPGKGAQGEVEDTETKRAWPRVGPDEDVSDEASEDSSVSAPAPAPEDDAEALALDNY